MVAELFAQTRIRVAAVYGLERWAEGNAAALAPFYSIFNPVTEAELKKISALATPQQVLAVAELPEPNPGASFDGMSFYLDGLRDPGNLGAVLRIADWFGFSAVYCSADCADAYSPKVVQASMGAVLRMPVAGMELAVLAATTPGLPVMGAVLDGVNVLDSALPTRGLLVIGNEGSGIRPETERLLTHRLTIPRAPGSRAESLNAAVAAGILAALLTGRNGGLPEK
ncbi:MAG: RNA methyltransferase [Saprospirales bacterium]|nr:RNA methyltransferase [Saprospirales bacterium]MBK8920085.1 RNA methyltransferase [Saprospirales bacterium]